MLLKTLAGLGLLATTVLADGASIVAAMNKIADTTATLNNTILAWDGGLLGVLPILADSAALLNDINSGTNVAHKSANLSITEAVSIAGATLVLSNSVNMTLSTIVARKQEFKDIFAAPVILVNLNLDKDASNKFSSAVLEKVPVALQPFAETLVAPIDEAYTNAIDAYNLWSDL